MSCSFSVARAAYIGTKRCGEAETETICSRAIELAGSGDRRLYPGEAGRLHFVNGKRALRLVWEFREKRDS